jgi:hypothetical protein
MELRAIGSLSIFSLMTLILIVFGTQIYASDGVKWKTFEEKNGLFTMKYPSNWLPNKPANDDEYGNSLLEMDFIYSGGGRSDAASVSVIAVESIFTNVSDVVDSYSSALSSKFKLVQPTECVKYQVKGLEACSIITTYKQKDLPGDPTVKEMDLIMIDEYGVQYTMIYGATKNLFDDFLPVAEEMIGSFNSGNILLPDDESDFAADEIPELPPLSETPTIKKL